MDKNFTIRTIANDDLDKVTNWAKLEGFAPGKDDISIYKNTDKQGVWVGCLNNIPVEVLLALNIILLMDSLVYLL